MDIATHSSQSVWPRSPSISSLITNDQSRPASQAGTVRTIKCPLPKRLNREAKFGEIFTACLQDFFLPGSDLKRYRFKHGLHIYSASRPLVLNLLKEDTLMGGMLVNKVKPVRDPW